MADKCSECRFRTDYDFCSAMPKNFCGNTSDEGKPDWCPLKNADGWISVKDRLPEERENPYTKDYQEVLCVLKTRFGTDVRVYKFGNGHFWNGPQEIDMVISHWMPLPEPPKEDSDD